MATTVGQHGVSTFTTPNNGDALDATVVKGNDNTLRSAYVDHDSDPGIHLQSSTLALRPAAGTAGRKWITTDLGDVRFWYDNGSVWEEVAVATTLPTLSVTGNTTLGDASSDTVTLNARVASAIVPDTNNARDIGTLSNKVRNVYVAGAVLGGTLTPDTLNIPSGTTIPTHTETGTITATGSTRNGGTISGATLNNTTFTGTVSGLNVNPTLSSSVYSAATTTNLSYSTYTNLLTVTVGAGTYFVIGKVQILSSSTGGTSVGGAMKVVNNNNSDEGNATQAYLGATSGVADCSCMLVTTVNASTTFTLSAIGSGGSGTPTAIGSGKTGLYVMRIA